MGHRGDCKQNSKRKPRQRRKNTFKKLPKEGHERDFNFDCGGRPYNQLLLQATRRGAKSFFRYFVLVLHRKRKVTEGVAHSFCSKSPYSLRVALADFSNQQQNMLLSMSRSICSNLYCCVLPCTTPYYSVLLCRYTTLLCTSLYDTVLLCSTMYHSVLLCTALYYLLLLRTTP